MSRKEYVPVMSRTGCYVVALLYAFSGNAIGAEVSGKITINKSVSRKTVALAGL